MTESQLFILAMLVTLVITVIIQLYTLLVTGKQRRQDLEDRKEVLLQAKRTTDAVEKASLTSENALKVVHEEVLKVGEQATAAYKEANQSNLKIQAVQDALTTALDLPHKEITETTIDIDKKEK